MGLGTVAAGRYQASIKDWGIQEAEYLPDQLEAWISFDFKDQAGNQESITWKSLVLTKAGDRNKKCNKTLEACGMTLDDDGNADLVRFMDSDALNMKEQVDITIIDQPSKDGTKIYKNVEWVNKLGESGGGGPAKLSGDEKLSMADKLAKLGLGKKKKKGAVKNHAPGATNAVDERDSEPSADDEIPF